MDHSRENKKEMAETAFSLLALFRKIILKR